MHTVTCINLFLLLATELTVPLSQKMYSVQNEIIKVKFDHHSAEGPASGRT